MGTKQIAVNYEKTFVESIERILDDVGLDFQSAINMFFKRIAKEKNIAFLIQNIGIEEKSSTIINNKEATGDKEIANLKEVFMEENIMRRSNKEITEYMRDHIWTVFTQNKKVSYTEYQEIAKKVARETGMNQGSAYIYFIILSCLLEGKYNTRTMKYSDLVYYLKRIKQECSPNEFKAALKSLESSVPYWEERIPGRFAEKVQQLVSQHKSE
jgi:antitoxin component of RelBE/YafQ-DinJ toxin-antitoxin module